MVVKEDKTPKRRYSTTWLLVLVFLSLVGLLLALSLQIQYMRALEEGQDRLMSEARTVDENVGVNLTIVNLLLTNIINMLQSSPAPEPAEINAYLRQQEKMIPGIRTILVTDRHGRVILSNRLDLLGFDSRNRDYFKSAAADASDRLIITPPFKSVLGSYVVNVTRVLTGKRGEFRGIVSASLDQEYFTALLRSVLYAPDNRVLLVHSSGAVFISVPDPNKVEGRNLDLPGSLFTKHKIGGQRASLQRGVTAATGENRVLAFVTSSPPGLSVINPLIVITGRDTHQMLGAWYRDLVVQVTLYVLFSAISVAIVQVALRSRQERKKALEEHLKLQNLESVGILAGGIAHDFNNLLTAILGYVEIAKKSPQADDKIIRSLNEAKNGCLRARELSERLLIFATGGNPVLEIRPLSGVIRAGVEEALDGSAIKLSLSLPRELMQVSIDGGQMRQVFFSLALNAREAMPSGGELSVRAENVRVAEQPGLALPEGQYVRVTMHDTGRGINGAIISRIFDPYFSTKDEFSRKGLGLGLAVCHAIVRRHGGLITAQSAPGEGSSIILFLPAASEKQLEHR